MSSLNDRGHHNGYLSIILFPVISPSLTYGINYMFHQKQKCTRTIRVLSRWRLTFIALFLSCSAVLLDIQSVLSHWLLLKYLSIQWPNSYSVVSAGSSFLEVGRFDGRTIQSQWYPIDCGDHLIQQNTSHGKANYQWKRKLASRVFAIKCWPQQTNW